MLPTTDSTSQYFKGIQKLALVDRDEIHKLWKKAKRGDKQAKTRIMESELVVPRFVLQELQTIADSADKLKRTRGRRGLDMLNKLQTNDQIDITILDVTPERSAAGAGVDEMLVDLALQLSGWPESTHRSGVRAVS